MPANDPHSFKKDKVDRYSDLINGQRMSAAERALKQETRLLPEVMHPMEGIKQRIGRMSLGTEEAHFLTMLTRDLGRHHGNPMKALDIGTFTGQSAGAMAKGMNENGGVVITCDVTDQYVSIAKKYWKREGVSARIRHEIIPGGAHLLLKDLVSKPKERNCYDIVFIDADKTGYDYYYEQALKLLRPGGKIMLDNMLWSGRVADARFRDPTTKALRNLNRKIAADRRVESVLLSAGDGLMVVEKQIV